MICPALFGAGIWVVCENKPVVETSFLLQRGKAASPRTLEMKTRLKVSFLNDGLLEIQEILAGAQFGHPSLGKLYPLRRFRVNSHSTGRVYRPFVNPLPLLCRA